MARYEAVIGLEVHAQLRTATKLFCSCPASFGDEPNDNVCEVCSGMPGVLPVLNRQAVEYAIKMGLAVNCSINNNSVFARKNYFYPDLPMGYQISQYELPLCEYGHLDIPMEGYTRRVGITRIHMENDAGKNIHSAVDNASFVDLNRAGTPLIEIVSEPDIRSAEEAVAYLKALHSIVVYLGICDGNMEEGSFRCDANVSIRPVGQEEFGTRAELKNLNSFRNVQRAIEYEISRQEDVLLDGDQVVQETRLYDADKNLTQSMRGKEEAHDYRYFPDPDLLPISFDPAWVDEIRSSLPELPAVRRTRFMEDLGLPENDAETITGDKALADYFEQALTAYNEPKKIANWVLTEFLRELHKGETVLDEVKMTPEHLAGLVRCIDEGTISGKVGKSIFAELFESGAEPSAFIKEKGLVQISDTSALESAVDAVLAENPDEVASYRGGKKKLMGFFVGQIMKKTKGQANPKLVNELLAKKLESGD